MAGRQQIPVTPALITWARKRAGYSVEAAQDRFRQIAAWEDESAKLFPTIPRSMSAFPRAPIPRWRLRATMWSMFSLPART